MAWLEMTSRPREHDGASPENTDTLRICRLPRYIGKHTVYRLHTSNKTRCCYQYIVVSARQRRYTTLPSKYPKLIKTYSVLRTHDKLYCCRYAFNLSGCNQKALTLTVVLWTTAVSSHAQQYRTHRLPYLLQIL